MAAQTLSRPPAPQRSLFHLDPRSREVGRKGLAKARAALADTVARTPLRRLGDPQEIARLTRFLVSRDAAFMTGQSFVVDGGHSLK